MQVRSGLELIQSFLAVAEELSFRRGAERLSIDQSALSRRIKKLERLLGFALFERTTRDVSLTPAGRVFYETNSRLQQDYVNSIDAARLIASGKKGVLRIAHLDFAAAKLMPQAIASFREQNPDVDIQMQSLRTQYQKVALANGEIDAGFMLGPFAHSEFSSILLKSDPLGVAMPSGHPLTRKHLLGPADLNGVELIRVASDRWQVYNQRIDDLFNGEGVQLSYCLEAANTIATVGFLAGGMGAAIYPRSFINFLGPGIEFRPLDHPDFYIELILSWRRSNRTALLRNFIEIAKSLYPR